MAEERTARATTKVTKDTKARFRAQSIVHRRGDWPARPGAPFVWYLTAAAASPQTIVLQTQEVAPDAPVA